MFTQPYLMREIKDKLNYFKKRNNIADILREHSYKVNQKESLHHSSRIEKPYAEIFHPGSTLSKKEYLEHFEETFENLQKAWKYGLDNIEIPFDEKFLLDIGYMISPEDKRKTGGKFRPITYSVKIAGSNITPPYPAKVQKEMDQLYTRMKKMDEQISLKKDNASYVDLASFAHFHLVRIHPFMDGNGRTARLIQNLMLKHKKIPPTKILEGERINYYSHLEEAVKGYRNRDGHEKDVFSRDGLSEGEKHLYDYLATKVNIALDDVLTD